MGSAPKATGTGYSAWPIQLMVGFKKEWASNRRRRPIPVSFVWPTTPGLESIGTARGDACQDMHDRIAGLVDEHRETGARGVSLRPHIRTGHHERMHMHPLAGKHTEVQYPQIVAMHVLIHASIHEHCVPPH